MEDAVVERLQRLAELGGGVLTPDAVVNDAKSAKSPLHRYFEWDDKKAADRYRLEQARELIRSVKVHIEVRDETIAVPKYVHTPGSRNQGYVEVAAIRSDVDRARETLAKEMDRVVSALRRAEAVASALGLQGEVKELSDKVDQVLAKLAA